MRNYLLVAIGGALGTTGRYAITQWMASFAPWPPLAILLINSSGCFLIALISFFSDPSGRFYLGTRARLFLMVGLCGGYTTFSSFSLLSFDALKRGQVADALLNVFLSHFLCLVAVWAGYLAGNKIGSVAERRAGFRRSDR